jgi:glutathione S-transferase
MLKLYGFSSSAHTRLVALICKEKNIPYELIIVDFAKGENKQPAFTAIQPFKSVPYIVSRLVTRYMLCAHAPSKDDEGFILYESRAIARYLIKKYPNQGTPLIPSDLKAEALFEQAASIEAFNFTPFVRPIIIEKVFKP